MVSGTESYPVGCCAQDERTTTHSETAHCDFFRFPSERERKTICATWIRSSPYSARITSTRSQARTSPRCGGLGSAVNMTHRDLLRADGAPEPPCMGGRNQGPRSHIQRSASSPQTRRRKTTQEPMWDVRLIRGDYPQSKPTDNCSEHKPIKGRRVKSNQNSGKLLLHFYVCCYNPRTGWENLGKITTCLWETKINIFNNICRSLFPPLIETSLDDFPLTINPTV